jgi:FkbM family methyltransferase
MFNRLKREIKLNIFQHYWNQAGHFRYYGQQVYFPKNSMIFRRAVKEGIYEHEILSFITPLIKPGTEVFDIGANIGLMGIPFLSANDSVKVISVEASPNSLPFLKKTHSGHTAKDRWTIIDKAVSDKEGKVNFHIAASENGAYDSLNNTQRTGFSTTIEIECTTIDNIWKSRSQPDVSFIKIDIEGGDLLALRGGIQCITKCRPSMVIEWNPINIKPFGLANKDLYDFARSISYTIYSLPYLSKADNLADLELMSKYTENFMLIPNA